MKYIVLYNPYSANRHGEELARQLDNILKDELEYHNMDLIKDFKKFFKEHHEDIIICGGDGTVNHFVNYTKDIKYDNDILYFSTGTGNDFYHEIGDRNKFPIVINKYIENLPLVDIKGKEYAVINGVGLGLDGHCCEVGDEQKKHSDKPVNYTTLALKGLLYQFKPRQADIYVDDERYHFDNVWLTSTMNGKFYGGGMKIAPEQERISDDKKVSVVVLDCKSRIKTLRIFPHVLKGTHVKFTDNIFILTGKNVRVVYDRPTALQLDGETFSNVLEYTVKVKK